MLVEKEYFMSVLTNLNCKSAFDIMSLLSIRDYDLLPPIKYIPSDIKNIPTLRNSRFIQRDAESIVNTSNLIWDKSSDDINTYAQKCFDYVLNDIKYRLAPDQSAYGTNYYQGGTCYGKLNLYAAFCRRRGIETRFELIPFRLTQGFEDVFLFFVPDEFKFLNKLIKIILSMKFPHYFLEIKLDNQWYNANPIQPAFIYKLLNLTPPGVDKKRRRNAKIKLKKGYVKPIYTTEINLTFNVFSNWIGRFKIADLINGKIGEFEKLSNII